MKELVAWLQSNPLAVLGMFVVSLVSGVMSIIVGWKSFYSDYLSKNVTIPVWLLLALFLAACLMAVNYSARKSKPKLDKELVSVEGKRFGVQQIEVDGKSFVRCEFSGTELIVNGKEGFGFDHCDFKQPRFTFGEHAGMTLSILTKMYADPAFRPLISSTMENIKSGTMPQAAPVGILK